MPRKKKQRQSAAPSTDTTRRQPRPRARKPDRVPPDLSRPQRRFDKRPPQFPGRQGGR